jgi:hypothetical protein
MTLDDFDEGQRVELHPATDGRRQVLIKLAAAIGLQTVAGGGSGRSWRPHRAH